MDAGLGKDFLLKTVLARQLYHACAAGQPIIDYHSHLSVAKLAADPDAPESGRLAALTAKGR